MTFLTAVFAFLGVVAEARPSVIPGTYEIRVCASPCSDDPRQRPGVQGSLVIFRGDLDIARLPNAEREYLEDQTDFILYPNIKPNACFVLETTNEETPLLAGLRRLGFTRWEEAAGVLTVTLYRSPDASDTSAGVVQGDSLLAGEPEAARIAASSRYKRSFLAGERTGDPDVSVCVRAATTEIARQKAR
jgi:hypothetical protein